MAITTHHNYRYYVIALLFLSSVVNFADRQVFGLLIESIKRDLSVTDSQIGLLTGFVFAIFHSIAGLPIARWADTGSRRLVIFTGMLGWSLCTIGCGLAANFPQLVLARLGIGVGEAAGTPTAHSLVSDYFAKDRRGTALGIVSVGAGLGVLVASLSGGWLNQLYGWRTAFIVLGIPGILLSLLIFFTLKEPVRGQLDGKDYRPPKSMVASVGALFSMRAYRHIVMMAALHGFVGSTGLFWHPSFMHRVHGLSSAEVGTTLAMLSPPFSMLGMLIMGKPSDNLARKDMRWYVWLMATTMLAVVPFQLFLYIWPTRDALYALAFISFGAGAGIPALHAVTQFIAPTSSRAMASAINVTIVNLAGSGIGAALVGILNDLLAPSFGQEAIRYSLLINAIAAVWCAFHALMAAKTLREDAATTAAAA